MRSKFPKSGFSLITRRSVVRIHSPLLERTLNRWTCLLWQPRGFFFVIYPPTQAKTKNGCISISRDFTRTRRCLALVKSLRTGMYPPKTPILTILMKLIKIRKIRYFRIIYESYIGKIFWLFGIGVVLERNFAVISL